MPEHTPGPWHYISGGDGRVIERGGAVVADCEQPQMEPAEVEGNAEFIVRACNAHDDLLAACQYVQDHCALRGPADRAREKLRRAILLATGDGSQPAQATPDPLLAACDCVLHELEHGEAGEGKIKDIRWCAAELRAAVALAKKGT